MLDVYTSDAITLGSCSAQNVPFDNSRGLTASFERLAALKGLFPRTFVGVRMMEVHFVLSLTCYRFKALPTASISS